VDLDKVCFELCNGEDKEEYDMEQIWLCGRLWRYETNRNVSEIIRAYRTDVASRKCRRKIKKNDTDQQENKK